MKTMLVGLDFFLASDHFIASFMKSILICILTAKRSLHIFESNKRI